MIQSNITNTRKIFTRRRRLIFLFLVGFLYVMTLVCVAMANMVKLTLDMSGSDSNMLPKQNIERSSTTVRDDKSLSSLPLSLATSSTSNKTLDNIINRSQRITIPDNDRKVAFIHIGKSGGSTISILLQNGCMTAADGIPCEADRWRKVPNQIEETIASKRILFYLHTPHVIKGNMAEYYKRVTSVVVVARDPMERFISAYLARHPRNLEVARKRNRQIRAIAESKGIEPPVWSKPIWGDGDLEMDQVVRAAYLGCFPSVDELVLCAADPIMIEENGVKTSCGKKIYNTTISWVQNRNQYSKVVSFNCSEICHDIMTGKKNYISHIRYNYEAFLKDLPPKTEVFVLRTTKLWQDWIDVNNILGATTNVTIPKKGAESDVVNARGMLPIRNNLSPTGQGILCRFLKNDIRVYIDLLNRAVNLSNNDVRSAIKVIQQSCPKILASLVGNG